MAYKEKTFVKGLVEEMRKKGAHVQRVEDQFSTGIPDINICYQGTEFWIEAKVCNTNKINFESLLRPAQKRWHHFRKKAGGKVFTVIYTRKEGWAYILNIQESFKTKKALIKEVFKLL